MWRGDLMKPQGLSNEVTSVCMLQVSNLSVFYLLLCVRRHAWTLNC
jgi:hypothetical protein